MLGLGLDAWNNLMLVSLGGAAFAALIVVISTYAVIRLQKLEAADTAAEFARFKLETSERIAEADARAAEANEKTEQERLARLKIEARLAPRTLPQPRQNELTEQLSKFKGRRGHIFVAPSTPESEMFARVLMAPLREAGWDIQWQPSSPMPTYLYPTGVIIEYPLPMHGDPSIEDSQAAISLANALNQLGIDASAVSGRIAPPDNIKITISTK